MKINADQLPSVDDWGWTELRLVNPKGETVALLVDVKEVLLEDGEQLSISGRVKGYIKDSGTDSRLANQKASIDRLLNHLKHHCPQLRDLGYCDYKESETDQK